MRNHWILEPIKKCNETTFWLNLLHLLLLTLIPFTVSLIGHYEQDAIAVIHFFSGSHGLPGFSLLLIHRYVIPKIDPPSDTQGLECAERVQNMPVVAIIRACANPQWVPTQIAVCFRTFRSIRGFSTFSHAIAW